MKAPFAKCNECPLQKEPCAPTIGPKDSKVAVVSRSPGYHESMAGKPFSGPSGKVLDHLLNMNGVQRDEILLTNVVLCNSPEKVPKEAIDACSKRLEHELKDAELIIAAGSEAVNELIGRGSIDRFRGYRHSKNGHVLVATNNPALVLRDDSTFPNLVSDFRRAFHPKPVPPLPIVTPIFHRRDVVDVVASLIDEEYIGLDIEVHPTTGQIDTIQVSADGETAYVFTDVAINESFDLIKQLLESESRFILHNGKYDVKHLRRAGINARVDEDTLLLSYALDERSGDEGQAKTFGVHGLKYLLTEHFGWPDYEYKSVKDYWRTGILDSEEEFYRYGGFDAAGTRQLFSRLMDDAVADDVANLYRTILLDASNFLMDVESAGFLYDVEEAANIYEGDVEPKLRGYITSMRAITDNPLLNPRSPKQMSALYYDRWHVTHDMTKRPDKKRSTDDAARKEITEGRFMHHHAYKPEVIRKFTEQYDFYKKLDKQASVYLLGLIERAERDPEGRIYTQLFLHTTATGRLSSRYPNLQNVSRTKEGLPDIRGLFRASPGRKIVQCDYSMAELRSIAAFSGDQALTRAFMEGIDLHSLAAKNFYGENFTKANRDNAKNMQFGVAFRQTADTFQEKHGIPREEAAKFIDWWWATYTGVKEWEKGIENEVRTKGVLCSPFGRKRRFHLLTRENLQESYRQAINFYPQSTASDLTLLSGIELSKHIDGKRANIILLVHDSILGDVDDDYVDEYKDLCLDIMASRPKETLGWTIPFTAEAGVGPTWAAAR